MLIHTFWAIITHLHTWSVIHSHSHFSLLSFSLYFPRSLLLFVPNRPLKEKTKEQEDGEEGHYVRLTGRTASGMVQEMLEIHTSAQKGPFPLGARPLLSPGSLQHSRYDLISPERTLSSGGTESLHGKARTDQHHLTTRWKEMGKGGESFKLEMGTNAWSEEEEEERIDDSASTSSHQSSVFNNDSFSSLSSCSTCTSEEGNNGISSSMSERSLTLAHHNGFSQSTLNITATTEKKKLLRKSNKDGHSSPEMFIRQIKTKDQKQKVADSGFFTMRPKKPKVKQLSGIKSTNRFSFKPRKAHSIEAPEITHPSPMPLIVHRNETTAKSLNRQVAIRGKKGKRASIDFSQPNLAIPESSYSFEVTNVHVIFKGKSMDVSCRGEHKWLRSAKTTASHKTTQYFFNVEFNTVRELKDSIAWHLKWANTDDTCRAPLLSFCVSLLCPSPCFPSPNSFSSSPSSSFLSFHLL